LEQSPGSLDRGQILFALVFAPAFGDQSVLTPDALDGRVGADAEEAEALALCERLLDAVWDFSRATA
jgi:hypothetical protein